MGNGIALGRTTNPNTSKRPKDCPGVAECPVDRQNQVFVSLQGAVAMGEGNYS